MAEGAVALSEDGQVAAMDIADGTGGPSVAPELEAVEGSARRATTLYAQLRRLKDSTAR